ncbi:MAG: PQQ-binding-like beta-propeller repeat protein [Gemmataceae bacterium]
MLRFFLCALGLIVLTTAVHADEWPQYRGPTGNMLTTEKQLPFQWDQKTNIQWKYKVPGRGWSSPIVSGGKVILTTAVKDHELKAQQPKQEKPRRQRPNAQKGYRRTPPNAIYRWEIHCLEQATGKLLWKKVAIKAKPRMPIHSSNTYASETPVTDGKHIYVYFGMMGVVCYDFEGQQLWKKDLGVYPMRAGWGTSSAPVLLGGLLYVQIDNEDESFLVALDKKTGKQRWRVSRDETSTWGSPVIWKNSKRTELVTGGNKKTRSYDPASGKLLWELGMGEGGGRSPNSATPAGDVLYVGNEERNKGRPSDGGGVLFAVKAGALGDITPENGKSTSAGVLWSAKKAGCDMACPLVYRGHVYTLRRRIGLVNCYNAKTGKLAYQERLPGANAFWASPWAYDGKIFCLDSTGTTHVLKAGPKFQQLAANRLGEKCWATPAIANNTVLLRSINYLYCIKSK